MIKDFLFQDTKKDKIFVGKIIKKTGSNYIVEDKKGRSYTVNSVLPFSVGASVLVKNDLILNSAKDLKRFTSFIV